MNIGTTLVHGSRGSNVNLVLLDCVTNSPCIVTYLLPIVARTVLANNGKIAPR